MGADHAACESRYILLRPTPSAMLKRLDVTEQPPDLSWLKLPFRHAIVASDHAFGERFRETANRIVAAQVAERRRIPHWTLCVARHGMARSALLNRHLLTGFNFRYRST